MSTNPTHKVRPIPSREYTSSRVSQSVDEGFVPRAVNAPPFANRPDPGELRAYTEEQVAGMLQISRSQLRKWRMGWSRGRREGPPFRKLGRMIRYPESSLRTYLSGT